MNNILKKSIIFVLLALIAKPAYPVFGVSAAGSALSRWGMGTLSGLYNGAKNHPWLTGAVVSVGALTAAVYGVIMYDNYQNTKKVQEKKRRNYLYNEELKKTIEAHHRMIPHLLHLAASYKLLGATLTSDQGHKMANCRNNLKKINALRSLQEYENILAEYEKLLKNILDNSDNKDNGNSFDSNGSYLLSNKWLSSILESCIQSGFIKTEKYKDLSVKVNLYKSDVKEYDIKLIKSDYEIFNSAVIECVQFCAGTYAYHNSIKGLQRSRISIQTTRLQELIDELDEKDVTELIDKLDGKDVTAKIYQEERNIKQINAIKKYYASEEYNHPMYLNHYIAWLEIFIPRQKIIKKIHDNIAKITKDKYKKYLLPEYWKSQEKAIRKLLEDAAYIEIRNHDESTILKNLESYDRQLSNLFFLCNNLDRFNDDYVQSYNILSTLPLTKEDREIIESIPSKYCYENKEYLDLFNAIKDYFPNRDFNHDGWHAENGFRSGLMKDKDIINNLVKKYTII